MRLTWVAVRGFVCLIQNCMNVNFAFVFPGRYRRPTLKNRPAPVFPNQMKIFGHVFHRQCRCTRNRCHLRCRLSDSCIACPARKSIVCLFCQDRTNIFLSAENTWSFLWIFYVLCSRNQRSKLSTCVCLWDRYVSFSWGGYSSYYTYERIHSKNHA